MKQLRSYLRNLVKGQHSVKSLTSVSSMLQNVPCLPLTFSCTTPAIGQCSNFNTIQRASQRLQFLVIFYSTASPSHGGGAGLHCRASLALKQCEGRSETCVLLTPQKSTYFIKRAEERFCFQRNLALPFYSLTSTTVTNFDSYNL